MSESPAPVKYGDIEAEYEEFRALLTAIREAIKSHTTAALAANGRPVSPGLLLCALLHEASNVTVLWGASQNLRPDDIEETFNHALRNAKRTLHGSLHQVTADRGATN